MPAALIDGTAARAAEAGVVEPAGNGHQRLALRSTVETSPRARWDGDHLELVDREHRRTQHARADAVPREPDRSARPDPARDVLAARHAGSSSSSPASAPPPPITTSSGSNVLIAFATPIPTCSLQIPSVRERRRVAVPRRGDHIGAQHGAPPRAAGRARSPGSCSAARSPSGRAHARRRPTRASLAGGSGLGGGTAPLRSRPTIVWPSSPRRRSSRDRSARPAPAPRRSRCRR